MELEAANEEISPKVFAKEAKIEYPNLRGRKAKYKKGQKLLVKEGEVKFLKLINSEVGVWNFRGLKDPSSQTKFRRLVLNNKLIITGIVETKVRDINMERTIMACFPRHWELLII